MLGDEAKARAFAQGKCVIFVTVRATDEIITQIDVSDRPYYKQEERFWNIMARNEGSRFKVDMVTPQDKGR